MMRFEAFFLGMHTDSREKPEMSTASSVAHFNVSIQFG